MAGTMGCLLLLVIILLISTVSGVIEVSFEKGVPRLNNSLYCDYYFACHTEGEILQWRVGNNVFNYSGQSTIGNVFDGSVSNCNYTATLLSLKPPSSSWSFKSALILTCQSNFSMPIICSDGSLSKNISVPEKELSLMAETINNIVYLEHVLSQNLVNADNSTCTNVFVCGVNNSFMDVQLGNTLFLFSEFDPIGREYNEVQDTSVQQAILIDKEPYSLVVAMYIVGSEVMNVTCGFSQNITFLSGMQCHPVTTMPETTGIMESESSTVGESSTMASEGGNNLPLIVGVTIVIVVLLFAVAAVIIITIVVCCKCCKKRSKRNKPEPTTELTTSSSRGAGHALLEMQQDRVEQGIKLERAEVERIEQERAKLERIEQERAKLERIEQKLAEQEMIREYAELGIEEKPKEEQCQANDIRRSPSSNELPVMSNPKCVPNKRQIKDTRYYVDFGEKVEYVFTVFGINVLAAASTVITALEENSEHMTHLSTNVYIGKIGDHVVGLIKSEFANTLATDISTWFKNTKYLISVGYCCAFDRTKMSLGDVVISNSIYWLLKELMEVEMEDDIKKKFDSNDNKVGLKVTSNRSAKHHHGKLIFGPKTEKNVPPVKIDDADGYRCVEGTPLQLQLDPLIVQDGKDKCIQYIAIEGVIGYVGEEERDDWKFMSSKAAFDYVENKITAICSRSSSQQSDSSSDESRIPALPVVKNPLDDTAPPIQ